MLDSLVNRGLTVAAIGASVAALVFWQASEASERRIVELQGELKGARADTAAWRTHASRRQRVEVVYRDATAGLNPDALSQACLADPELARTYDAIERMRASSADAPP